MTGAEQPLNDRPEQQRPLPSLTLTGTGTSVGVPVIGCDCEVCRSDNPRNRRLRSGVLVRAPLGDFVIDASPDLREQLLRERVSAVHAAVFTHSHADHIMGLDDLRICGFRLQSAIKLLCEERVERQIRTSFNYAFETTEPSHRFAVPRFEFERIGLDSFSLLGLTIQPLRLMHGRLPILGFRINNIAFCTDVSQIPPESLDALHDLDVLIIDALRNHPHPTHFSVPQAVAMARQLNPRQTYLTHVSCRLDYDKTNERLPEGIELAWDGLRISL